LPIRPKLTCVSGRRGADGWRRVAVAVAALAFLGAGAGTAFGLSRGGEEPGAPPGSGGSSPSVTAEASSSESTIASGTPSTGGTDCGPSCPTQPTDGTRMVAVPHLVGIDEATARKRIQERGLSPKVQYICSGGGTAGAVTAQHPSANSQVAAGRTVTVEVVGVQVPNVVEYNVTYAQELLTQRGLQTGVTEKVSRTAELDTVLAQNPAAHSCVRPGSTVTLTIAAQVTSSATPTEP